MLFESIPICDGNFYRPQTKLREGYVFTGVCDSVHKGGVLPHCMLGHHPPSWQGRPPWQGDPPGKETPLGKADPPCTVHAGGYGQQAGGMHPTGRQSCKITVFTPNALYGFVRR